MKVKKFEKVGGGSVLIDRDSVDSVAERAEGGLWIQTKQGRTFAVKGSVSEVEAWLNTSEVKK